MRHGRGWIWVGAVAAVLATRPARGQLLPFAVEGRGGAAGPLGELAQRYPATPGPSFAVTAELRLLPLVPLWGYLGYGEQRFRSRGAVDVDGDGVPDGRSHFEAAGYALGVRGALPSLLGLLPVVPWARLGVAQLRWSAEADDAFVDSEPGTGSEAALGFDVRLAPGLHLVPGATVRHATVNLRNSRRARETLQTWAAELGLRLAL